MRRDILGKYLIDGKGSAPVEEPVVVIEDGIIADILPKREWRPDDQREGTVYDFGDSALLPGLIDATCTSSSTLPTPRGRCCATSNIVTRSA